MDIISAFRIQKASHGNRQILYNSICCNQHGDIRKSVQQPVDILRFVLGYREERNQQQWNDIIRQIVYRANAVLREANHRAVGQRNGEQQKDPGRGFADLVNLLQHRNG